MKKLRYDEAYEYAQTVLKDYVITCHDFAGFVVGADWARLELQPIPELWNEFLYLMEARP